MPDSLNVLLKDNLSSDDRSQLARQLLKKLPYFFKGEDKEALNNLYATLRPYKTPFFLSRWFSNLFTWLGLKAKEQPIEATDQINECVNDFYSKINLLSDPLKETLSYCFSSVFAEPQTVLEIVYDKIKEKGVNPLMVDGKPVIPMLLFVQWLKIVRKGSSVPIARLVIDLKMFSADEWGVIFCNMRNNSHFSFDGLTIALWLQPGRKVSDYDSFVFHLRSYFSDAGFEFMKIGEDAQKKCFNGDDGKPADKLNQWIDSISEKTITCNHLPLSTDKDFNSAFNRSWEYTKRNTPFFHTVKLVDSVIFPAAGMKSPTAIEKAMAWLSLAAGQILVADSYFFNNKDRNFLPKGTYAEIFCSSVDKMSLPPFYLPSNLKFTDLCSEGGCFEYFDILIAIVRSMIEFPVEATQDKIIEQVEQLLAFIQLNDASDLPQNDEVSEDKDFEKTAREQFIALAMYCAHCDLSPEQLRDFGLSEMLNQKWDAMPFSAKLDCSNVLLDFAKDFKKELEHINGSPSTAGSFAAGSNGKSTQESDETNRSAVTISRSHSQE